MNVHSVEQVEANDSITLQAQVDSPKLEGGSFRLWYRFPASLKPFLDAGEGSGWVATLFPAAMVLGEPLEVPYPVAPELLRGIAQIQTVFHLWDRSLQKVPIVAPARTVHPPEGSEVGLFFSSGVDSGYSLWKNVNEHPADESTISKLLVIHGFDIPYGVFKREVWDKRLVNTYALARHFGKEVVPLATNARELLLRLQLPWDVIGHGVVLAAIGLFLERMLRKVYVSSGYCYKDLEPDGCHPMLAPFWSTPRQQFICDGVEVDKVEKVRYIARSAEIVKNLRVCWDEHSDQFNCGKCTKCLRTMVGLYVAGVLDRCPTLPHTLDCEALSRLCLHGPGEVGKVRDLANALGNSDEDQAVRRALVASVESASAYYALHAKARWQIEGLIPPGESFILVDEELLRGSLGAGRPIVPFLEKDGAYYGPPPDSETAVSEFERLRTAGARYMVFWSTAFWWLDYYEGLRQHLRTNFQCVLESDSLIVFRLVARAGETSAAVAS